MKRSGANILNLISLPVSIILSGHVLSVIWGWFIVSTFSGIPPLSIPQAIGLESVIRFVTSHYTDGGNESDENTIRRIVFRLSYPIIALGVGAIVKAFI